MYVYRVRNKNPCDLLHAVLHASDWWRHKVPVPLPLLPFFFWLVLLPMPTPCKVHAPVNGGSVAAATTHCMAPRWEERPPRCGHTAMHCTANAAAEPVETKALFFVQFGPRLSQSKWKNGPPQLVMYHNFLVYGSRRFKVPCLTSSTPDGASYHFLKKPATLAIILKPNVKDFLLVIFPQQA